MLEVCAGLGLWARLLRNEGVSVLATDAGEPRGSSYVCVERRDALTAITVHGACDALLLCWPPNGQPVAAKALERFAGTRFVYIGDSRFTGDAAFHGLLDRDWGLERLTAVAVLAGSRRLRPLVHPEAACLIVEGCAGAFIAPAPFL